MVVVTLATASLLLAACAGQTTDGGARAAAAASPSTVATPAPAEGTPSASPAPDTAVFGRSTRVCIVNSSSRDLELTWDRPGLPDVTLASRQENCQDNWMFTGQDIQVFIRHSRPDFVVFAEADNPSVGKPQAGLSTVSGRPGWSTKTTYDYASCLSNRYTVGDRWSWDSSLFEVTITRLPDSKGNVEFTYEIGDSPQPSSDGESRSCAG